VTSPQLLHSNLVLCFVSPPTPFEEDWRGFVENACFLSLYMPHTHKLTTAAAAPAAPATRRDTRNVHPLPSTYARARRASPLVAHATAAAHRQHPSPHVPHEQSLLIADGRPVKRGSWRGLGLFADERANDIRERDHARALVVLVHCTRHRTRTQHERRESATHCLQTRGGSVTARSLQD
jgi:hypothetical protein